MRASSEHPGMTVAAGEPFTLRVSLDLRGAEVEGSTLDLDAVCTARRLGGTLPQTIAELSGKVEAGDELSLELRSAGLAPGTYRLEVAVGLGTAEAPGSLSALLDGGVLQVS
jgi:hypothetical protein